MIIKIYLKNKIQFPFLFTRPLLLCVPASLAPLIYILSRKMIQILLQKNSKRSKRSFAKVESLAGRIANQIEIHSSPHGIIISHYNPYDFLLTLSTAVPTVRSQNEYKGNNVRRRTVKPSNWYGNALKKWSGLRITRD